MASSSTDYSLVLNRNRKCAFCSLRIENARKLPCGHKICGPESPRSCAKVLEGMIHQRCRVIGCANVWSDFAVKIKAEELPRVGNEVDSNSTESRMDNPPTYQEAVTGEGGVTRSPAITGRQHIAVERSNFNFCNHHQDHRLSFFCKICKVEVCQKCWEESHVDDDLHRVVPFSVLLKPQKAIQEKLKSCSEVCLNLGIIVTEVIDEFDKLERKQREIFDSSTNEQIERLTSNFTSALEKNSQFVADKQTEMMRIFDNLMYKQIELSNHRGLTPTMAEPETCSKIADNALAETLKPLLADGETQTDFDIVFETKQKDQTLSKSDKLSSIVEISSLKYSIDCVRAVFDQKKLKLYCLQLNPNGLEIIDVTGNSLNTFKRNCWPDASLSKLCDIALCRSNELYGLILGARDSYKIERFAVDNFGMRNEVDTELISQGNGITWRISAYASTLVVGVRSENSWKKFHIYKNEEYQRSIELNCNQSWFTNTYNQFALCSEMHLLVKSSSSRLILVSFDDEHNIPSEISLNGVRYIKSIVWVPKPSQGGYLLATDRYNDASIPFELELDGLRNRDIAVSCVPNVVLGGVYVYCYLNGNIIFGIEEETCFKGNPALLQMLYDI